MLQTFQLTFPYMVMPSPLLVPELYLEINQVSSVRISHGHHRFLVSTYSRLITHTKTKLATCSLSIFTTAGQRLAGVTL